MLNIWYDLHNTGSELKTEDSILAAEACKIYHHTLRSFFSLAEYDHLTLRI